MRPCACQPVLVPCSFFLLPDFTPGYGSPNSLCFRSNPAQGFPPADERLHLDHPAITECVDIRKAYVLPMVSTLWGEPGRQHDKPPAVYLGPSGTGLRQIRFHAISPMIRAAAREPPRLGPLDERLERFGCGHIGAMEPCVRSRASRNRVFQVRRNIHISPLSS